MRSSLLLFAALGCSAERVHSVDLPPVEARATPIDAHLPPLTTATRAAPPQNACLMLYECGCNAGCMRIDQPLTALTPGMQVGVASGALAGTQVFVAKSRTDQGESVFTIQRADPKSPILICATNAPLIGYLCATSNSGAARACDACE